MDDPALPRPRRLWRYLLIVSLALNLAVVGLVIGLALRFGSDGPPRGIELALGPLGRALSDEDRRAIAGQVRRDPALRAARGRTDSEQLITVLETEPFDPARMSAALASSRESLQAVQARAQEILIGRLAAMSPAQRAALAARLREADQRRRR